jgi:uncharacterized protein YcbK (DUF882 family)
VSDQLTPHFRLSEFRCPCCNQANQTAALKLALRLEPVRSDYGVINIISGFRCRDHNAHVGGKPNSQHLLGLAADIITWRDSDRYDLLTALLAHGFKRIGIGADFVHADIGTPTGPVAWTYY